MSQLEPIHTVDDLVFVVDMTFAPGSPVTTLTGATVEAYARYANTTVAASSIVAAGSQATITFNDGVLAPGDWEGQVIVSSGTLTQTVAEFSVTVKPSFRP